MNPLPTKSTKGGGWGRGEETKLILSTGFLTAKTQNGNTSQHSTKTPHNLRFSVRSFAEEDGEGGKNITHEHSD